MASEFSPKLVEELAAALPPDGANPIGKTARSWLISHTKTSLPGKFLLPKGRSPTPFVYTFFSGTSSPYSADVIRETGLAGSFWSDLSIAALCEQMYNIAPNTGPNILIDEVRAKLSSSFQSMKPKVAFWYAFVATKANSDIKTALASFPDAESKKKAKENYIKGLTSVSWINKKIVQDNTSNWTNRDWELFHHWIKLKALGASQLEIDETITKTISLGLPVPSHLAANNWLSWSNWLVDPIGGNDVSSANEAILKSIVKWYARIPWFRDEGNSYNFTLKDQPGYIYHKNMLSGSCFSPGTKVVMADGSLKNIEDITKGERIKTRDGSRKVFFKSSPHRNERDLYKIDDLSFSFTESHPFMIYNGGLDGKGTFAATNPDRLIRQLPSLAQYGIRGLTSKKPPTLTELKNGEIIPFNLNKISKDESQQPEVLYDLILEIGEDGVSEYFVGDENIQLLVSSEIPRFLGVPGVTHCVLTVMERCSNYILETLKDVPDNDYVSVLADTLDGISDALFSKIGQSLVETFNTTEKWPSHLNLSKEGSIMKVNQFLNALSTESNLGYDRRIGILLELFVARFVPQFQAAIKLGWRSFDLSSLKGGTILAVSLYSIEVFGKEIGFSPTNAEIKLTLSKENAIYTKTVSVLAASSLDRSYYSVDDINYFSEWRAEINPELIKEGNTAWTINVSLKQKNNEDSNALNGRLILPNNIEEGYRAFTFSVTDSKCNTCGLIRLDARTLNAGGLSEELDARKHWKSKDEIGFAHVLADKTSGFILDYFEDATPKIEN